MEQFYRKAGQVSRYTVNNQPYVVVTVPPNQPGETTVSCEQVFRLLAATAQKLEEEDKKRHIIIDADLIWLYFKLEPKLALTAITMALAHAKEMFKSVEVQASTKLMKIVQKMESCVLSKQLPVIVNKQRTFNISIPLDDTGRVVNLKETISMATNIEVTPANYAIEFNEGTARFHEDLNMCRANAIRIFRVREYTQNRKHGQRYAPRYHVRAAATRGRQRRRQRLREEEIERDEIFQERMENRAIEDQEDGMFETTEMDEVTHPQFQDPIIQRHWLTRK